MNFLTTTLPLRAYLFTFAVHICTKRLIVSVAILYNYNSLYNSNYNSLSIIRRYPNISLLNPTLIRHSFEGSQHQQRHCYFFAHGYLTLCLLVSASVSYILRLRKGYIPGTIGYVIYSPGTAPEATCGGRLFLFRFIKGSKQKQNWSVW